jgi:hypothetical protein
MMPKQAVRERPAIPIYVTEGDEDNGPMRATKDIEENSIRLSRCPQ